MEHQRTVTDVDDLSGSTLAGRFRLLRQLGRGGMGAVYLADDLSLAGTPEAAPIAVKVIKSALLDDASAVKRFEREAVAVGKLNHPNIVGFRGTGSFGGISWLAMEFLEGSSLRERIAATGAVSWRESLSIMAQIADGLAAAHAQAVVHRDLKPDNVMLVNTPAGPVVKLLDFGIAKQVDAEAMTMTGTGLVVGTPGFIAPEVIVGGPADDPRSDLYALGVVWFEMLTGSKPFDAPTPFALALKHVQEPAPRVNAIRPFTPVPAPVEAAVMQLLEKSPDRRPATAEVLLKHLQALIYDADHPLEPATSTLRTAQDLSLDQKTETNFQSQPNLAIAPTLVSPATVTPPTAIIQRPQGAPFAAIAGGVVIIVLVIAVVVLALRTPQAPVVATPAPTPTPTVAPVVAPVTTPPVVAPPPVVSTPTPPVVSPVDTANDPDGGKAKKPKKPKLLLDP